MRPKRTGQILEAAALVLSAHDRDYTGEALDRAPGRVDVGGLRVVHEAHSVDLADQFEHVLQAGERRQRRGHAVDRGTGQAADGGGGHDIRRHVTAGQPRHAERHERHFAFRSTVPHHPVAHVDAEIERAGRGVLHLARGASTEHERLGLIGIQHAPVAGALVGEDARLGPGVAVEVGMPIQMVGRQVEQRRNPRMEGVGRLELEAAGFDDMQRVGCGRGHVRAERHADVAAHQHRVARGLEHLADERRGRRLPLRAGDGDEAALQPTRGQLQFADDRHTSRAGSCQFGQLGRHAGARHDQIHRREEARVVPAEVERHAGPAKPIGLRTVRHPVGERHNRAARHEQLRSGASAARGAHHEHTPSGHRERRRLRPGREGRRHGHRSFNVVRLKSANRIATMRKRVITLGSLQPMSSKWW